MSFETLPLHDALLGRIEIDWDTALVWLDLQAFSEVSESALPYCLLFRVVTDFRYSRINEWGPSNSILDAKMLGDEYHIQMQSGDSIFIKASGYEFRPTNKIKTNELLVLGN
ncbi:hypothetical protein [Agarivorans litoreus]|uniref:hypothetical protein n=1 Tax=Agarivorans litoreus TaxID=1510455 RepID=UPI001C7D59A8|nr:hypothetical protein [Agarivorans litoreus]